MGMLLVFDSSSVSAVASLISAAMALIGVPIVLLQIRDLRKSARSQALSNVYEMYVELDRFLVDNAPFRHAIYEGKPATSLPTHLQDRADAVAEFVTDILYQAFSQKSVIGLDESSPEVEYIRKLFASPILRDFLSRNASWYNERFVLTALGARLRPRWYRRFLMLS